MVNTQGNYFSGGQLIVEKRMQSKQIAFGLLCCVVDGVLNVQKKIQLDLEHLARKSRQPIATSQVPPPASSQHRLGTEDIEDDDVERITLDDMFVIDSAGEYSVSGDEADAPAADDDRRRQDFKRFLSYLQSVACDFQETVRTSSSLIARFCSRMQVLFVRLSV